MSIRIITKFQPQLLRHFSNTITEKEKNMICKTITFAFIHEIGFICSHVSASFHL